MRFLVRPSGRPAALRPGLWALVALIVLGSLAGCTRPEQGEQEGDAHERDWEVDAPSPEEAAGMIPIWFSGLVFRYEVVHHPTGESGELALLVLDGPDEAFTLDPLPHAPVEPGEGAGEGSDPGILPWVLHEGVPLGPVREADFEPRVEDEPLDWFSFPIHDADAWVGEAPDGGDLQFEARLTQTVLPDGEAAVAYEVTGRRDGAVMLEYTYTSLVGWFVSYWWDADRDGEPELTMDYEGLEVRQHLVGRALRVPERFLDLGTRGLDPQALEEEGPPAALLEQAPFQVPQPEGEAWFVVRFDGGPGVYDVNLTFSEEHTLGWQWVNQDQEEEAYWDLQAVVPGVEEAEARVLALAEGKARVSGYQMVPME